MSRYAIDPPDEDRYNDKPLDAADEPQDGEPQTPTDGTSLRQAWTTMHEDAKAGYAKLFSAAIDPAEHAAHSVMVALETLSRELINATEFQRVMDLWKMGRDLEVRAATIVNLAAKRADEIIERRR